MIEYLTATSLVLLYLAAKEDIKTGHVHYLINWVFLSTILFYYGINNNVDGLIMSSLVFLSFYSVSIFTNQLGMADSYIIAGIVGLIDILNIPLYLFFSFLLFFLVYFVYDHFKKYKTMKLENNTGLRLVPVLALGFFSSYMVSEVFKWI